MKTVIQALGAFLLLFATGCGSLKVTPSYAASQKGPLSEIAPLKLAINVEDARVQDERVDIGRLYNAFGGVARKIESVPPVTNVIRAALASELQTNGHQVVEATAAPDAILNVSLKRFFYECKPKMWDVEVVVTTLAQIEVARAGRNAAPITVSSTHQKSRQIVGPGSHVKIINDGLAAFAHSTSFEPKLLEALSAPRVSAQSNP